MRKVKLIGVPSDLGANVRGARRGPKVIRKFLIPFFKKNDIVYKDLGDIPIPKPTQRGHKTKKNLQAIKKICYPFSRHMFGKDDFPLVLGGDHSITICFVAQFARRRKLGMIYFDAHGDYNNPNTTPSGNIHGMVLGELAGYGGKSRALNLFCEEGGCVSVV